jgi:hypothetical protein
MFSFPRKKSDLEQAVWMYLQTVPAEAPIRKVLASAEIRQQLAAFDRADHTALRQQRRYWQAGWLARLAALLGVLLVPIELLPLERWLPPWSPMAVNGLRGLTLLLTFVAIILLGLRRSAVRWKQARGEAEKVRGEFFRKVVAAGGRAGALDQALACFKAAHLDWQIGFYDKRIRDLPRRIKAEANQVNPFRLVGIVLSLGAATLGGITLLKYLAAEGVMPSLSSTLSWFPEPARWQHGLNATASSLLAFAGARFLTYEDISSAALYPWARAELARVETGELGDAQAAAARGDVATVQAFCARVQRIFDTEHGVWVSGVPLTPAAL